MKTAKLLSAGLAVSLISGCSVPGMHMADPDDYSQTVVNGKVIQPKLIQITPALVIEQHKQASENAKKEALSYKTPEGFSTNTKLYSYHIGTQDILNIVVWDYKSMTNPANNQSVNGLSQTRGFTVNANGDIFYPYIGYVHVLGLTVSKARDLISEKLAAYVKDPQVTVDVIGFNSQKVNVIGAVKQQRSLKLTNVPLTVLDAVNQAGGVINCSNALKSTTDNTSQMECADTKNVQIKQGGYQTTVDLNTLLAPNGSSENWLLKNGAVVYVPSNELYKIYILGELKKTGVYNMLQGKMTLSDAIAAAGGVTDGSAPAYTYVIRSYNDHPSVYTINVRSPDALLLAGQFNLLPHDIVFVSTSGFKDVNQVLQYISPLISTSFSTAALVISATK
ncbi:polysaccharide biosynthesis/export family protein [Fangia hongkongensis]|uniref:polysaccharide biosynthesis/export family protein n=1 Tax=Fangia hongkongensis TaxID=270495 RepID=UPI0003624DDE|nr:polysaccharide biosynthesis/export family protein [Fangia hongkongensis]MBK2125476.1 polysaccharide biosynthesis/export family protein [Fangia hongkongensis]